VVAEVHVRVADGADLPAVERVLLASYPTLMSGAYNATSLACALPRLTQANPKLLASGSYCLAAIDGEPVGCGGWSPDDPLTGNVAPGLAHLRHFAVAAEWTGNGIGRAITPSARMTLQRAACDVLNATPASTPKHSMWHSGLRRSGGSACQSRRRSSSRAS
jgi:predicted N-acetyltransferase YhbS